MFKEKSNKFKVAVGTLVLTGVFAGIYMGVNYTAFGVATEYQVNEPVYEEIDTGVEAVEDEGIAELEGLEPMPHIITNHFNNLYVNQVLLLDLTTGEPMVIYEFDEYEIVEQVWDFGNGYYAAWVGYEPLCERERRREWILNDWVDEEPESDYRTLEELNFRLVIFDENLNKIESLPYEEETFMNLFDWGSVVKFVDGELVVYNVAPIISWDMRYFGWEENFDLPWNFQRVNLHTGAIDILFGMQEEVALYEFIKDNQILISIYSSVYPYGTSYGILDLETGEMNLSEKGDFGSGAFVFSGSSVMFNHWDQRELMNEVIVFNLENMSSEVIQLGHGDSLWARPSFDENYIVTINENESVFRKYDMNGNIVAETEIVIPFDFDNDSFEIFPLTDEIYAIHIHTSMFADGRHIQMITLDGQIQVITPDDQVIDLFNRIEWMRLSTPEAHHLSEEEARVIGIEWIYEEFDVIVDGDAIDQSFFMEFEHEELGFVERSFWIGRLEILDVYDYDSFGNVSLAGNSLNSFTFVLDGVTGERVAIADEWEFADPVITTIEVNGMSISVSDSSGQYPTSNPSNSIEQQSYHLTAEEAAVLIAETIYEDFNINLDGHTIRMNLDIFETMDGIPRATWWSNVIRYDESYMEGFQLLFIIFVDAITGEIVSVEDTRDIVGQGTNQRNENREIVLDNMQFTVHISIMGNSQPNQLSFEEIAEISANAIYEEFAVSLDGLFVTMFFWGEHWTVTVQSAENGEYLFQLFPDAETGEIGDGSIVDFRGVANPQ